MRTTIVAISLLLGVAFTTAGCDGGGGPAGTGRALRGWDLAPSDHEQVMQLVRKIYQTGIGTRIVAWYETETRGYFDRPGKGFVEFERPIRTLSVAIPDYVSYTDHVQSTLEQLASTMSHNGWRLQKFRVELDPHGAGGGPAGTFDKVTIYPIEVVHSR